MGKNPESYNWRYERKFLVPFELQAEIYNFLLLHPAIFSEIYQRREINNIYFDSIDRRFYTENINGIGNRKKIRIRWYGELYGHIKPTLEIKSKKGMIGTKESYRLPEFNFTSNTNLFDIKQMIVNAKLPENIRQEMLVLSMSLLNSYSRRYFLSLDRKYRITIDTKLKYFKIDNHANIHSSFMAKDYSMILELKYAKDEEPFASNVSSYFPFRLTRNSKYVNGVNFIRG